MRILSFMFFCVALSFLCPSNVIACMPDGSLNKITLGKKTYVCITISPLNWYGTKSKKYLKMASSPTADDLTRINVQNSWTNSDYSSDTTLRKLNINSTAGNGLGIVVESMGVISYQKAYRIAREGSVGVTYPLMMAIISVEKGKVVDIIWDDDGCTYCEANNCAANVYDFNGNLKASLGRTCWMEDRSCMLLKHESAHNISLATNELCELNVYVVWTGTDSNGIFFSSNTARFSQLSQSQLVEVTDDLRTNIIATSEVPFYTSSPSLNPTSPTTKPTVTPTSPTVTPSLVPSAPTFRPSTIPSTPSVKPIASQSSSNPTVSPSAKPTSKPTNTPTNVPTTKPTSVPTKTPTNSPSVLPTAKTDSPTIEPTI